MGLPLPARGPRSPGYGRLVYIVLASPDDVRDERNLVPDVVEEVNSELAGFGFGIAFKLLRHEVDARPGLHPGGPQALVDEALDIPKADLVIGIFWRRFGTPTATGETGTEHEIRLACKRKAECGRPEVMVYFKNPANSPSPQSAEEADQWRRVLAFKDEIRTVRGVKTEDYSSAENFRSELGHHLMLFAGEIRTAWFRYPPILACSAHAVPRTLRDGGLTELVGDVVLTCTSLEPTGVDAVFDIRLYLWYAAVSNRIVQGVETDAVITDHGGRIVHGMVVGDPFIVGDPANCRNCLLFQGVRISLQNSTVQAGHISYTATGPRTILIRNVRVVSPSKSNTTVPTQLYCHVDVRGSYSSSPQVIDESMFPVATVERGFEFYICGPNSERDQPVSFPLSFGPVERAQSLRFTISFKEGFAGAFKSLAEEVGYGSDVGAGFAHHGTRLLVRFSNIPPRFEVSVTARDVVPEGESDEAVAKAVLVRPESEAQQAGHDGAARHVGLSQTEGRALAEWEFVGPSASPEAREIRFGAELDAGSLDIYTPEALRRLPSMCIAGCLAPLSTVDYASAHPIPRFRDWPQAFAAVRFIPRG
jgi:hypothetical protein